MRSRFSIRVCGLVLAVLGAAAPSVKAQECYIEGADRAAAAERASPLGETDFTLGGEEAKICYGRPSVRGREIMGELVPFGRPWRLGANEATALHLPFAAVVGGLVLEPGSYSLYAIPGESEWTFVVNTNFERWGIPIDDEVMATDAGRFTCPASATEGPVERLTFRWEPEGAARGELVMEWENTRVGIPIEGTGL
jgi:hypothetical protein